MRKLPDESNEHVKVSSDQVDTNEGGWNVGVRFGQKVV